MRVADKLEWKGLKAQIGKDMERNCSHVSNACLLTHRFRKQLRIAMNILSQTVHYSFRNTETLKYEQ
jgi:hypothetical protein